MAATPRIVTVQITAVHLQCTACGAAARVARHDDAWEEHTSPLGGFWVAHLQPEIVLVEVTVNGQPSKWPVAS